MESPNLTTEQQKSKHELTTIAFYFYKGGVGRTYLAAQVARILAARGKKVVVLDFDMDAPGIPGAFSSGNNDNDYYAQLDESEGSAETSDTALKGGFYELVTKRPDINSSDTLNKYLINVDIGKLDGEDNDGWIKILPTGMLSDRYWQHVSAPRWMRRMGIIGRIRSLGGFIRDKLKPALEKNNVDYLLIDSRAGITHYGSIARGVSDKQIFILTDTTETRHTLGRYVLPHIEKDEDVYFVIARVPYEFSDNRKESLQDAKTFLEDSLKESEHSYDEKKVIPISSDLQTYYDLQIRAFTEKYRKEHKDNANAIVANIVQNKSQTLSVTEVIAELELAGIKSSVDEINNAADSENKRKLIKRLELKPKLSTAMVPLHEDILMLVACLCPEVVPSDAVGEDSIKQAHALWEKIYDYPFKITLENVLFVRHENRLYNIDDDQRNVSFKAETFRKLLQGLQDGLKTGTFETALGAAGKQCGESFGAALRSIWGMSDNATADEDKIPEWCAFDSRTGFGDMVYDVKDKTITVANSFVMDDQDPDKDEFVPFFNGYVEGVLSRLGYQLDNTSRNGSELKYKVKKIAQSWK
jgi:MinD-like ATPase involved in chromosome partitioning or flagellar assembly